MSHLRPFSGRMTLALLLACLAIAASVALTTNAASTIDWQEASTGLPTTNIIRDAEFADVDHDGKPDLILAGNVGVVVYKGNGAGVWAGGVLSNGLPTGGIFIRVAVGDLDNDGHVDIVASGSNPIGVQGWYGDGAGNWTAIGAGLPTGTYGGIALADVNLDGRPDIIAAGSAPVYQGVHVYLNFGGSFSQTTSLTTTGQYEDIAAAYVDNDGYIDVAAAANATGLKFWRGGFNNSWTYTSSGLTTTNNWRGVTFGDTDLDGKPELVAARSNIAGSTGGGLFVYDYEIFPGSWSLAPDQLPVTHSYFKLVLADLNNDGRLDVTAGGGSTFLSQGIYQWLGSINGFVATTSPTTTGSWERPAVGDFNRDGLLDVGAGAFNGGGARAWRSTGVRDSVGSWTLIASPQITDSPRALWAADINRDGDTDVMFNRAGGGLNLYRGDGGNAWTYCAAFNAIGGAYTGTYESVIAAPFDRNIQYPQIVGGRADGGGLRLFGNYTADCSYFFEIPITTTGSYRALSAADIDDDSYWQLVAAPYHLLNQGLRVFENGANGWQLHSIPVATGTYCDTALADFNNDGKHDIAAAECTPGNGGGLNVFEYWSRGWISHNLTGPGMFYAVAAGDLNNDGKDDLVAAKNSGEQGLYVWTGDGAFNFTPWPSPDVAGEYFDLDLGDVDHDGWLDILAARDGLGVMVWLGDGAGGWTPSNTNLPASGAFFRSMFSPVDHDGNLDIVSTGFNQGVKIWTAAEAAPPTISNIQPTEWVTTTTSPNVTANVLDAISGISTTSGLYRYSTNGGVSWSSLFPASIGGSNGSTGTQVMTATAVAFGQDSGTQNVIELRASDMVGNVGTAEAVIKIDTTPPTAPASLTSSSHTVSTWSNDNTVSISWSGATDATSGVFGYSVLFDQNPSTLPPPVINVGGTSFNSAALADGNNWYAHVRTRDLAGNWSTTARHLGPFFIDTTPPTNPTTVNSTDHTLSTWSDDPTISMSWSGAGDTGGSGVSGYSYVFDTAAGTLPDAVQDTSGTSATSASLPSGNNKYFHIRTRDNAGNWSAAAVHRGPYWIDVTAPSSSVNSPATTNSTSFTVFWSGSDAHSGIDSYDVQYRNKTTNGAWTTWRSATASTSGTFNATSGHIYEFRSRARDNAGNLEPYPGTPDLTTEVRTIDVFVRNPGIEVNQGVQDLNNSVTLIARKRTFVRCYVQSDAGTINNVNARLRVYRGATYWGILSPSNSGSQINIRTSPDRAQLNHAYYFDVPTGWLTAGTVRFECEVNLPKKYAENDYGNNVRSSGNLTFVNSREMNIAMIDINYFWGGVERHVRSVDRTRLAAWLRAAYPIHKLNVYYGYFDPPYDSLPNADTVNGDLAWNKAKKVFGAGETSSWRYYGQAYDIGGFMRGKSVGTPGNVAVGPTGDTGGWDPDGNYGDWYGGHENGHSYGRAHVQGAPYAGSGQCGDEAGPDGSYPYAQGRMSPQSTMWTNSTLYGFDWSLATPFIVPPTWYDVMTYCPGQWISDYTYEAIYNRMNTEPVLLNTPSLAGEHLGVFGTIITATDTVTLSTLYRVPEGSDVFGRDISGTYHIKLLDAGHGVLADYNFSPRGTPEPEEPTQSIMEFVPWVTGTQYVVIANAAQHIYTRTVSSNTPTVTLQAPSGGITLTGSSVIVSWTAADVDNDVLTFSLDYSTDGGVTWNPLSGQIPSTTVSINLDQLPGSPGGKFRVWVSDGVNTAYDETDGTFVVANKAPRIDLVLPISGTAYIVSQTVSLEASVYDAEDGPLTDAALQWSSDLDGALGSGDLLQLDTLSVGTHTITLTATDSSALTAATSFTLVVSPEPDTGGTIPDLYLPIVLRQ